MFKGPIFHSEYVAPEARHINMIAEITQLTHSIDLVKCINTNKFPEYDWRRFLRNAYLALGRLPDDDVEAHHIKGMLTEAVDIFTDEAEFRPFENSVTMDICDKLEDWETGVFAGKIDPDAPLRESFESDTSPTDLNAKFMKAENSLRLKFRLDVSREIGIVPMQELQRVLATLPFDITLTTPTERATLLESVPRLTGMMINIIPAEVMHDFHRFRLQYTFDKVIENQLVRDLIKERMQERKIGGCISWQIDSLVITATCGENDTLADAVQWRCKVEEELMEVLSSLTGTPDGYIR